MCPGKFFSNPILILESFILAGITTALKMEFSVKDFFSKCDQIRKKLQIW